MSILSFVRSRIFVALLVLGAALMVAAACGDDGDGGATPAGGETPPTGVTPTSREATAEIKMVPTIRFDRSELTIAADTVVTITADNTDDGIRHNFAVFTNRDSAESGVEPMAATEICGGPCTGTTTLSLAAGEYFFRCQVHPSQMTGTLVVQ